MADTETQFIIKDSGERKAFAGGMVRDTGAGKTEWHRVTQGPMFKRWAEHLTKGAIKYPDQPDGQANWTLANDLETLLRFKYSAFRHFMQWWFGLQDEDHAAATIFNINGAEYVKGRLNGNPEDQQKVPTQKEIRIVHIECRCFDCSNARPGAARLQAVSESDPVAGRSS